MGAYMPSAPDQSRPIRRPRAQPQAPVPPPPTGEYTQGADSGFAPVNPGGPPPMANVTAPVAPRPMTPVTPTVPAPRPKPRGPIAPPTAKPRIPEPGERPVAPPTVRPPSPAPPVPPPPTPITPATSPVGSGLRGEVYTPGDDPRLAGAQGTTDAAMRGVTGANRQQMQGANESRYRDIFGGGKVNPDDFGVGSDVQFRSIDPNVAGGPSVNPTESARTATYGAAQDDALAGLGGPDRTALAKQKLQDFDAVSNEQRFNEERALGQNISKFGRSGLQTNADNFGDITRRIAGDRGRLANELASSVAEGDINDRFRRVDATSGLRGQEAGLDALNRGEQRTEREYSTGLDERNIGRATDERDLESALNERNVGRQMTERDTRLGIATGNQDRAFDRSRAAVDAATRQTDSGINDTYDQLSAAGTLEDRVFNQGRGNRDEFRTERENQNRDAQQTIENRIKEREIQQAEEEMRLRRAALQAQAGGL